MSARVDPAAVPERARALGGLDGRPLADRRFARLLRLWLVGPEGQATAWSELSGALGAGTARRALRAFEAFLDALAQGARGPIWRHAPCCACLGRDEARLADSVAAAARGDFGAAAALLAPLIRAEVRPAALGEAHRLGRALGCAARRNPDGAWLH